MRNKVSAFYCILAMLLYGCDPNRVYEENQDIESAIWKSGEIISFDFPIEDDSSSYNLHLNIRNGIAYPFHNLYVKYELRDSARNELHSELKEVFLFDPKTGEPYGDGLGDLFDNRFPLLEQYQFDYPGIYTLGVQQFMRIDSIPMVVSVGLRVEKTNE